MINPRFPIVPLNISVPLTAYWQKDSLISEHVSKCSAVY